MTIPMQNERFGQPKGLWTLAGTEFWDRVSFHGMVSMLVLYMTGDLLAGTGADHVAGFAAYRVFLQGIGVAMTPTGIATQTFGLYFAGVTFLPLVGGWLGDRVLTRRTAVASGALAMTAGHFCMAFDTTFLLALVLLVIGAGLLRGNLTPQIRALYADGDRRLADAFQAYSFCINIGAFVAPIASGAVAKAYGWHAGFAVAGFGMLAGLVWYLAGSRHLPVQPAPGRRQGPRTAFTARERRGLAALAMVWPVSLAFWTTQAQIWNVYSLWVRDHIRMEVGGFTVPIPWLQSLDGLAPAVAAPILILLWRWQAARGSEPATLTKAATGCLIMAASTLLLAAEPLFAGPGGLGPLWLVVLFHLISNFGAISFAPVIRAFFAERAPESVRGTVIGLESLSVTGASLLSGVMGGWYQTVTPPVFWTVSASIAGTAGVALLLVRRPLVRWIEAAPPIMPDAPRNALQIP
ncbi:MAG: peptide MFS transporter [Novosphingobium sp.]|nr:peptide MFS transporter [Novosphingobium sp.]